MQSLFAAILLYASIMFVVMGATILAQAVSLLGVPQVILETVRAAHLSPLMVLSAIVLIYLILGCFFDGLSLMIMIWPGLRRYLARCDRRSVLTCRCLCR